MTPFNLHPIISPFLLLLLISLTLTTPLPQPISRPATILPPKLLAQLTTPDISISIIPGPNLPDPSTTTPTINLLHPTTLSLYWPPTDITYEQYTQHLSTLAPFINTPEPNSNQQPQLQPTPESHPLTPRQPSPQCYPPILNDVTAVLACASYLLSLPAPHNRCGANSTSSITLCSSIITYPASITTSPDAADYRPRGATVLGRSENGEPTGGWCSDAAAAVLWVAASCKMCGEGEGWCSAGGLRKARGNDQFLLEVGCFLEH